MRSNMWGIHERSPIESATCKGGFLGKVILSSRLQKEKILGPNGSDVATKRCVRDQLFASHGHTEDASAVNLLSVLPAFRSSATALELALVNAKPHTLGNSVRVRRAQRLRGEGPGSNGGSATLLTARSPGMTYSRGWL